MSLPCFVSVLRLVDFQPVRGFIDKCFISALVKNKKLWGDFCPDDDSIIYPWWINIQWQKLHLLQLHLHCTVGQTNSKHDTSFTTLFRSGRHVPNYYYSIHSAFGCSLKTVITVASPNSQYMSPPRTEMKNTVCLSTFLSCAIIARPSPRFYHSNPPHSSSLITSLCPSLWPSTAVAVSPWGVSVGEKLVRWTDWKIQWRRDKMSG